MYLNNCIVLCNLFGGFVCCTNMRTCDKLLYKTHSKNVLQLHVLSFFSRSIIYFAHVLSCYTFIVCFFGAFSRPLVLPVIRHPSCVHGYWKNSNNLVRMFTHVPVPFLPTPTKSVASETCFMFPTSQ